MLSNYKIPGFLLVSLGGLFLSTGGALFKLFENQEIEIFKYSGLKNSKILSIISVLSLFTGIIVISIFYHVSISIVQHSTNF